VLFESRAICQYLAAKAGSPLLPTGDAKRVALFQQALSVERANFDICVQPIARQRVAHRMMGLPTDEAVVQEAAKTLQGKLAVYDAILSTQKYLAGAEPTLADLYHLPYGTLLLGQGFPWLEDKATFPHLAR
jgi:glutathione S-transferase